MKFKQLTYTSLEKGWTIERCLGSPDEIEKKEFVSISSRRPLDKRIYSYDYRSGVGVLSCSVPYGTDTVGRDIFYLHGYVFSGKECDEVFSEYSKLLGISYFATGVDSKLSENTEAVMPFSGKLNLPDESVLAEAFYEALLSNKRIEVSYPGADGEALIKAVINTVMEYVPLQLRKFISFGSCAGSVTRMVTATEEFSSSADVKIDLKNGTAAGLSGKYCEAAQLISGDIENSLAYLEKKLDKVKYDKTEAVALAVSAVEDLVFEESSKKEFTAEELPERLTEVLDRNKYSGEADIKVLQNIFCRIEKYGASLPAETEKRLAELYSECPDEKVRKSVSDYISEKIVHSENVILSYEEFAKQSDNEFYQVMLAEKLTASKSTDIEKYAIKILEKAYLEFGELLYERIEKSFVRNGLGEVIEEFYASFLAKQTTTALQLELWKENLEKLSLSADKFADAAVGNYAKLCLEGTEKGKTDGSKLIEKISHFADGKALEEIPGIKDIKKAFWKQFDFSDYEFTDDICLMALPKNRKSELANALLKLMGYVTGNNKTIDAEDFNLCRKSLCSRNGMIKTETRKELLKLLKQSAKKTDELDVETILLINYNVARKTAKIKGDEFSERELCSYIEKNICNKNSMLRTGKIYKTLYKYVLSMAKSKNGGRKKTFGYGETAELMKHKQKKKRNVLKTLFSATTKREQRMYLILFALTVAGNAIMAMLSDKYASALISLITLWGQFAMSIIIVAGNKKKYMPGFWAGVVTMLVTLIMFLFKV